MSLDKKDEDRDDWFEVLGLELDATGEMVNKGKSKWQPLRTKAALSSTSVLCKLCSLQEALPHVPPR